MTRNKVLQELFDITTKASYGRTHTEAQAQGICTSCGKVPGEFREEIHQREYKISGMCQECQDTFFGKTNG